VRVVIVLVCGRVVGQVVTPVVTDLVTGTALVSGGK